MENYLIQTCSICGSYLIPRIRYQYGVAWTEHYCERCGRRKPAPQLIYSTTTDDYDIAVADNKTQKKFKSRLIKKDEEYEQN